MDSTARSHRRAVWLLLGLTLAFVVGLLGYELNWIRQREALRDEEFAVAGLSATPGLRSYRLNVDPYNLAPLGSTAGQRILGLLGDPPQQIVDVTYLVAPDCTVAIEDVPKVRGARALFPEAHIRVWPIPLHRAQERTEWERNLAAVVSE